MNSEHYDDPTADIAIGHAEKERREKRKQRRYKIRKLLLKKALEQIAEVCGMRVKVTFIDGRHK